MKAYDGEGMLEKRMEVRPRHLEGMKALGKQIICAGGLLDDEGKMKGSALVMEFPDRAALEDSQNAGFTYLPESGRFLLRWAGVCREADPADEGVPPEVGRVMAAVRDRYHWLLYR
jgi:uncharacterized protein YciI